MRFSILLLGGLSFCRPALAQTIQFDPAVVTPAATKAPTGLAAGDFNEDGHLDLVRTDPVSFRIQIFLGDGRGGFSSLPAFGAGGHPAAVAVGDLNGDGHLDLVLSGMDEPTLQYEVLIAFGKGDGTFQVPLQTLAAPGAFPQIVITDLNGDSAPDVVAPFVQTSPAATGIAIYLNDGRGGLVEQPSIVAGTSPNRIVVADFTGDRVPDLAMSSDAGFDSGVSLIAFNGVGDGTFGAGTPYQTPGPVSSITSGDINGDGKVDLILAQPVASGRASGLDLFAGNGDGTFRPAVFTAAPVTGRLFAADLNHDGRPDIAASGGQGLLAFGVDVEGNFETPIDFSLNGGPLAILGDFNGDGVPDAACFEGGATAITVALNSTPAVSLGPGAPVSWIDPVNVTVNGGSLQKSGGCDGCFDASAASQQAIDGAVDSGVRFVAAHDPLLAVGLSASANATTLDAIDFAIRPQNGFAEVRERGVYRRDVSFQSGDEFRILIQGTVVRYLKNGAPFYVSSVAPTYPLHGAVLIASASGTVSDAMIFGAAGGGTGGGGTVTWGSAENVTVDGARVTKTSGCDGCFDASALAGDQIETDGFFEFTADASSPLLVAGLTTSFTTDDPSSIDFGIRLQNGDAEVREDGVYKADVAFRAGDVFRISVTGGVVSYAVNGVVFYTSAAAPGGPLLAAASFASLGASIDNATMGISAL
jgi:hypothetical protein